MIRLTLPYAPSANTYWRNGRHGTYVSEEAKDFKYAVRKIATVARVNILEGALEIVVNVFRPRKSGDLDNRLKVMLDAMNGICYADDEQIERIVANRFDDSKNPRIEITIRPLADALAELERLHAQFGDIK